MRILIVEDDVDHANVLHMTLSASGHVVTQTPMTVPTLDARAVDLLIVSLDLPEECGMQMLMDVRAQGQQLPILAVSSSASPEHIATALDRGADDYMVMPLAMGELAARVRALGRRCNWSPEGMISYGHLKYQLIDRGIYLYGQQLFLSHNELVIMEVLFERRGRVVSAQFLAQNMLVAENRRNVSSVAIIVYRLRLKMGHDCIMIETIHGFGYRLRRVP